MKVKLIPIAYHVEEIPGLQLEKKRGKWYLTCGLVIVGIFSRKEEAVTYIHSVDHRTLQRVYHRVIEALKTINELVGRTAAILIIDEMLKTKKVHPVIELALTHGLQIVKDDIPVIESGLSMVDDYGDV